MGYFFIFNKIFSRDIKRNIINYNFCNIEKELIELVDRFLQVNSNYTFEIYRPSSIVTKFIMQIGFASNHGERCTQLRHFPSSFKKGL